MEYGWACIAPTRVTFRLCRLFSLLLILSLFQMNRALIANAICQWNKNLTQRANCLLLSVCLHYTSVFFFIFCVLLQYGTSLLRCVHSIHSDLLVCILFISHANPVIHPSNRKSSKHTPKLRKSNGKNDELLNVLWINTSTMYEVNNKTPFLVHILSLYGAKLKQIERE